MCAVILLIAVLAQNPDEPTVPDPVSNYVAYPPTLVDKPRPHSPIDTLYRIRVDFRGEGQEDILLSDEAVRDDQDGSLSWTVYQPTDGGYVRRMNGLGFSERCSVEATPGRKGKAILIYERWGPKGGTVTALRMDQRGFVDLPKQIVREVDPGTEKGARYLDELFSKKNSPIEKIDVSHMAIPRSPKSAPISPAPAQSAPKPEQVVPTVPLTPSAAAATKPAEPEITAPSPVTQSAATPPAVSVPATQQPEPRATTPPPSHQQQGTQK